MLGPATSRNLVITRAGANSLHERWLNPSGGRDFDLLVASFVSGDPGPDTRPGIFHIHVPGSKIQGWKVTLAQHSDFIEQYDFVALIDDDIDTNATDLSRLFAMGQEYGFNIFQPSLTWDSFCTYAGTIQNPFFRFRCVNYIEMMAPFFSRTALKHVAPLFEYGWESGIDLIWGSVLPPEFRRFAIIDAIPIRHTRPVGVLKEANGFVGRTYESDIMASLDHFGMTWPSLVASSGLTRNGRWVGKMGVSLRSGALLALPFYSPGQGALRRSFDHIRHQFFRNPKYSEDARHILARDVVARSGNT